MNYTQSERAILTAAGTAAIILGGLLWLTTYEAQYAIGAMSGLYLAWVGIRG